MNKEQMLHLTKKEKEFLISWLSDDLDLAIENRETSSNYLINKLKSILKKLTKKGKNEQRTNATLNQIG